MENVTDNEYTMNLIWMLLAEYNFLLFLIVSHLHPLQYDNTLFSCILFLCLK